MNLGKFAVIVFCLPLLFVSCKEKIIRTNNSIEVYKNNKLFKSTIIVDSMNNISYTDFYYRNGNLKKTLNYENNLLDGNSWTYYKNGNLKSQNFWHKNKLVGQQYRAYNSPNDTILMELENGEYEIFDRMSKIKYYRSMDLNEEDAFFCKYNRANVIKKFKGIGITQVHRLDSIAKVKIPYDMILFLPEPPYAKSSYNIYELDAELKNKKAFMLNISDIKGAVEIAPCFEKPGKYYLMVVTNIDFDNSKEFFVDTNLIPIHVIKSMKTKIIIHCYRTISIACRVVLLEKDH